jgi:hypothetical protein
VVGRLRHLDDTAELDDGLALGDQLLGGLELADDLLRRVPGALHGRVPGQVWPAEDFHSPWTNCRGPRHTSLPLTSSALICDQDSIIARKARISRIPSSG